MATLLLQTAGGLIGGLLGPIGAAVGTAVGAAAGYYVDQSLFGPPGRRIEGPRLTTPRLMTAEEGSPVPRAYGHVRLATTVIWATRFEEERRTERHGGKGGGTRGTTVTTYSYFGNIALAICEGPVAMVKRVWADGQELDLTGIDWRFHAGGEDQEPDPLIVARQGEGNAPAYRGISYIVLERLALEAFGNRIPQIQVEVIRPVGQLERDIRAVSVIPGSTEHAYSPHPVTTRERRGETVELTRHILHAGNDWAASIDELQAVCPNLEHVALVIAWFGDDLRAGQCTIRPGVTERGLTSESPPWRVAGLGRNDADVRLVSRVDGRAAYGGSPSDASVIAAIEDLKARGFKVTLHPFVMMDVPDDNDLPDPHGGAAQPGHPWRGRVTCHPAAGQPGSADRTASAASQIDAFVGNGDDWGYRRFVTHLAALAQSAGGIDAMLIGSELRGLTRVRDGDDRFVFVSALRALAAELRDILGPDCKLTYGADWSEYFGFHPPETPGDVHFNLDPLWADPNIDAIGIDNYMPLSDWRDEDRSPQQGNPDGFRAHDDSAAMRAQIAAGEGFDWYYASQQDRRDRVRTQITDGAGKPWVWRYKDLVSWWSNHHYDRIGGVEAGQPTEWVPGSKPFWMTEAGCGAIHAGANQPSAFTDPKSIESKRPYQSDGSRSDSMQRAFLEAHHRHWARVGTSANPMAQTDGTPMVDPNRLYVWAWDARPFPAFPRNDAVWGDGGNWLTGHWLNGRLGVAPVAAMIDTIFAEHGLAAPQSDAVSDVALGMSVPGPTSARSILEPIAQAFGIHAIDTGNDAGRGIRFSPHAYHPVAISVDDLCRVEGHADRVIITGQADELPGEVVVRYRDAIADYIAAAARARRVPSDNARVFDLDLPCTLHGDGAAHLADLMLDRLWAGRDRARCMLPLRFAGLEPGDVIAFDDAPDRHWRIESLDITDRLDLSLVSVAPALANRRLPEIAAPPADGAASGMFGGPPDVMMLDLPLLDPARPEQSARIALYAVPDRAHAVFASPGSDGFERRVTVAGNAVMGTLLAPLDAGASGRFDHANTLSVALFAGRFASVSNPLVLGGRNAIAVEKPGGMIEIIQFRHAEEVAAEEWRLSGLLRGQAGTDDATALVADPGATVALLDERAPAVGLLAGEEGRTLNWRVGPAGRPFSDRYFTTVSAAFGHRALMPYAPVHLRARALADGALELSWIRRTRVDGDAWDGVEVPLGEEREAYAIELRAPDGALLHAAQTETPSLTLSGPTVTTIFGAMPSEVDMRVAQISMRIGPGLTAVRAVRVKN